MKFAPGDHQTCRASAVLAEDFFLPPSPSLHARPPSWSAIAFIPIGEDNAVTTINPTSGQTTLPSGASRFSNRIPIRSRYDNWIGGEYVPPVNGQYFINPSPVTGQPLCEVARSTA